MIMVKMKIKDMIECAGVKDEDVISLSSSKSRRYCCKIIC